MTTIIGRRVVITGMGLTSPLAHGVIPSWQRLIAGKSGIRLLPEAVHGDTAIRVGGLVPSVTEDVHGLDLDALIAPKEQRKSDRFIHLALAAAAEAVEQAGLHNLTEAARQRTATIIATGIGGFHAITQAVKTVTEKGSRKLSPFTIPSFIGNLAASQVAIKYGLKGMLGTPVSACAASIQSIGDAMRVIRYGEADVALAGGTESCVNPVSLGGFQAARALSTDFNDRPALASRPFDAGRDGFVMSEGAGVLVLESLEHAQQRGATILAEVAGYGTTSDAYHITAGPEDGEGAARSMTLALQQAGLAAAELDYVNAHSTSTPVGDVAELNALRQVLGDGARAAISSTKSATGHLLGAAGALGAIFSVLAIREGIAPPSLNIDRLDERAQGLNIVQNEARQMPIRSALVNGFGFGGVNGSLVLKAFNG
ncbi:beta-ketoacyl-ACP synthase II [Erwinia sp. E602]|uniref:beta-ketoacyl-ACP synthase II n=1 Tax=Erwinia sp. E602 TaxID=2675378 RepID=UPI001BA4F00A|nr:beta-ketoacyl-ACP synthase II [Erwinia sp. E602]